MTSSEHNATASRPRSEAGPRVGVLLWKHEHGPADISGMPWSMREALARAGCQVTPLLIDGRPKTRGGLRSRGWDRLVACARDGYDRFFAARVQDRLEASARELARRVQSAVSGVEIDAVFAPLMSHALAFYGGDPPVIYATDSTASLLGETYAPYRPGGAGRRSAEAELETRAIACAARVVVPTEFVRRSAIEDHGAAPDRVAVVPMGAARELGPAAALAPSPPRRDDLRLLLVAKDPERKRLGLSVEVTRELRRRGWAATLHYVGPKRPECALPEVCWAGYLSKSDPGDVGELQVLLRDCHIALLPSVAEMFGIATVESAAYSRPAVVSDAGGLPTVVLDHESGRVVPTDSAPSVWADAVESVAADPSRYADYGLAARARFERTLNWDAWGRATRAVIEQVLQPARR